jgi:hypothetical protein
MQHNSGEPTQKELDADFERLFGHAGRWTVGRDESTPWVRDQFGNLSRLHGDLS